MSTLSRRRFSSGLLAAGATAMAPRPGRAAGANERVRLGMIGLGNRGDQLIDAFAPHPDAEFAALCDVYAPYVDFARQKVGGRPFTTGDYRAVLDRKDIDAVVIATPDHWHALQFVEACQAGKDVYVEKPVSLVVREGRLMVEAARRYGRITQVGVHRRSVPVCMRLVELIRGGAIGRVTACRCFHISNEYPMGIGCPPDGDPPAGLDWDMWLGPAPKAAYNPNRCFYKFRWFRAYSGGQMTNFGTHWLDLIQWAIGQDAPLGVFAVGSRTALADNRDVPDTMEAVWDYPDGTIVSFGQYNANAAPGAGREASVEFRGTNGTLYLVGDRIEIVPEAVRLEPLPALDPRCRQADARQAAARSRPAADAGLTERSDGSTAPHARDFLDGVKQRRPCRCPIEVGHRSTTTTLIANVACDRKRYLAWDAEREQFANDAQANALLTCVYREPWKLPGL